MVPVTPEAKTIRLLPSPSATVERPAEAQLRQVRRGRVARVAHDIRLDLERADIDRGDAAAAIGEPGVACPALVGGQGVSERIDGQASCSRRQWRDCRATGRSSASAHHSSPAPRGPDWLDADLIAVAVRQPARPARADQVRSRRSRHSPSRRRRWAWYWTGPLEVAGHDRVVQKDAPAKHIQAAPGAVARLAATVSFVSVAAPEVTASPPPCAAELPASVLLMTVSVPESSMPPPRVAWLFERVLFWTISTPEFSTPPPDPADCPRSWC